MSEHDFFIENPKIEGITENLVSDLFDISGKFGVIDSKDNIVRFSSGNIGLDYEIYIGTSIDGSRMLISKSRYKMSISNLELIKTIIGEIFWDRSLTAKDAEEAIKKIYELGEITALRNLKPGKYVVDEIFSDIGTTFMVDPDQNPEEFINRFDKPEQLQIAKNPAGVIVIHHKDHLPYIKKREKIARDICKERGIDLDNIHDIGKLDFDYILELRKEIDIRMKKSYS